MNDITLFVVGIIVGVMNAIAGGGMLLGFPVLLSVGVPPLVANATSPVIVLTGQLTSAIGYRKYLKRLPKSYLWLIVPCAIGGAIGATSLRHTTANTFERLVPALMIFAVLLFAFQPWLHKQVHLHLHGSKKHRQAIRPLVTLCIAMLPLSIYGGYFGAGFGFIMLAFLGLTKLHEIHQMNALKNLMAVVIATVAIVCLSGSHLIDWRHGLFMAAGNAIGGYIGARGAQKFSSHAIRLIVIAIGICTASYLALRSY